MFYDFDKKKPKDNKNVMIQYKDYGWGDSYSLKTAYTKYINGKFILYPTILGVEMSLDRVVRWCY